MGCPISFSPRMLKICSMIEGTTSRSIRITKAITDGTMQGDAIVLLRKVLCCTDQGALSPIIIKTEGLTE
jgi:hypothetical protein